MADQIQSPTPTTIDNLTPDLIQEILSHLPLNSVYESRCVCPLWRDLINDPRFPLMHYTQATRNQNQQSSCSLLSGRSSIRYIQDINTCEKVIEIDRDKFSFKSSLPYFDIVGSVNGFLCLEDHSKNRSINETKVVRVVICNPVNRDSIELPEITIKRNSCHIFLGFGYSPKSCEYKVVKIETEGSTGESNGEIVTVGDDSWRSIGNFTTIASKVVKTITKGFLEAEYYGVFLNGFIHWLIPYNGHMEVGIRAFDVENETFVMVPFPEAIDNKQIRGLLYLGLVFLGVLGGCLMFVDYSTSGVQQVWVMKKYGVKESWVLEYVVPVFNSHTRMLQPLEVSKDGKVLAHTYRGGLFSYDPENESVEGFTVPGISIYHNLVLHEATLVSLKDVIESSKRMNKNR